MKKDEQVLVKMDEILKTKLEKRAEKSGVGISTYIRMELLKLTEDE